MGKRKNDDSWLDNFLGSYLNDMVKDIAACCYEDIIEELDKLHSKVLQKNWMNAYHEAGHVVAFYNLRKPFNFVTIHPLDDYDRSFSIAYVSQSLENFNKTQNIIGATIGLAGFWAEYKKFGGAVTFGGSDCEKVNEIITKLASNLEGQLLLIKYLLDFALDVLESPGSWEAVESLAKALMKQKTIDYISCKKIIKNAKRRARRKKLCDQNNSSKDTSL